MLCFLYHFFKPYWGNIFIINYFVLLWNLPFHLITILPAVLIWELGWHICSSVYFLVTVCWYKHQVSQKNDTKKLQAVYFSGIPKWFDCFLISTIPKMVKSRVTFSPMRFVFWKFKESVRKYVFNTLKMSNNFIPLLTAHRVHIFSLKFPCSHASVCFYCCSQTEGEKRKSNWPNHTLTLKRQLILFFRPKLFMKRYSNSLKKGNIKC